MMAASRSRPPNARGRMPRRLKAPVIPTEFCAMLRIASDPIMRPCNFAERNRARRGHFLEEVKSSPCVRLNTQTSETSHD